MTNEFFLHPVSPSVAARIPFPVNLPLDAREAYMANPPAEALAEAARVPFDSAPPAPPVVPPAAPVVDADDFSTED